MSKIAHQHLMQVSGDMNHELALIIQKTGEIQFPEKHKTLADHLCHSIISQQLSKQAASTIISRIRTGLNVPEINFSDMSNSDDFLLLKESGVSRFKVKAIQAVLERKSTIELLEFTDAESLITELTKIWGVGTWTAEMAALFFYRFEDVWSLNDAALKRGILNFLPVDSEEDIFTAKFSPYRSFLSLHIWQAIDNKLL